MDNKKKYTCPTAKVFCIMTRPLMTGSNPVKVANEDYDGRPVLSREGRFSTWEDNSIEY